MSELGADHLPTVSDPLAPVTAPPVDAAGHREVFSSPVGEKIFRRLIIGKVFLWGVLLGFLFCCLAGFVESRRSPFKRFLRFHRWINTETQFYPTVSQMIETARREVQPDQVAVIIGSDSILFGSGQRTRDIWTIHLQELLGPKYKVVVMAYPGASFAEGGAIVAEAMAKQKYKVILVSHLFVGHLNSVADAAHPQVFWEAWERNLLMKDPVRDESAMKAISNLADNTKRQEIPLEFGTDAYLHFNDMWTAVGYRNFFTVWEPLSNDKFYWARKHFRDPEVPTPIAARNPPRLYDESMALIRKWAIGLCKRGPDGHWMDDADSVLWTKFEKLSTEILPEYMRQRTVAVITYENPFYRRDLSDDERERNLVGMEGTRRRMNQAGYDTVVVGKDFAVDDFFDVIHMAPSGGAKMADAVAPEVVKLAKRFGYDQ